MIRVFRPADVRRIREITADAFDGVSIDQNVEKRWGELNGVPWHERKGENVAKDTVDHPAGVFVAEAEGELAGYVICTVEHLTRSGHIRNLAVDSRFRGRGLGRALIERAEQYFRDEGMLYARIETLSQNAFCMEFYPHMGYEEVARNVHFFKEFA